MCKHEFYGLSISLAEHTRHMISEETDQASSMCMHLCTFISYAGCSVSLSRSLKPRGLHTPTESQLSAFVLTLPLAC